MKRIECYFLKNGNWIESYFHKWGVSDTIPKHSIGIVEDVEGIVFCVYPDKIKFESHNKVKNEAYARHS